jgi:hypothetical protein
MISNKLQTGATAFEALTSELVSDLSRNYMIRFYPDSKSKKSQLIGVSRFAKEVQDVRVFEGILQRLDLCMDNKLHVKLRRGIAFTIIYR